MGHFLNFSYYSDGSLKQKTTNTQKTYYTPSGLLEKTVINGTTFINSSDDATKNSNSINIMSSGGVSVLYNINNSVGVTDYCTYYGLTQSGFNCYTHAIAKRSEVRNPGYYSGRSLNLYSLSGIKLNVEKDQESLGRRIYDTTVGASISGHSWKIVLRINPGNDYHFMICSSNNSAWQFKAGIGGPVMRVLNGYTPDDITWDIYVLNSSTNKYEVYSSSYYTSAMKYMMITN
ncbi:MAG: hypothetical protein GXY49_08660 [Syntrophomonadaceae bacterium]|nr:hypothetical protein [Syntrophomonadaceae bacterium]